MFSTAFLPCFYARCILVPFTESISISPAGQATCRQLFMCSYKLYLSLSSSHHTDVDALEVAPVTSLVPAAAKAHLKHGWRWHLWWVKAHR